MPPTQHPPKIKRELELEVPILVMGRVITRIFGVCSGAVPSACHSETGCVSTAVQRCVAHLDSTR